MQSTFHLCAYLWVQHAPVASGINECVCCVGGFKKGLQCKLDIISVLARDTQ